LPGIVRTYAPCGQTPILRRFETRDHLSVMSGVTMTGRLYTMVREQAFTSADSVFFISHLLRFFEKVMVIWDRSPIHKGEVREYLSNGAARKVRLEQLPPYALELNPDEGVWQHLKHVEMRNLCCSNLIDLRQELHFAIMRLRSKPYLIESFFAGADLSPVVKF